jgi:hypothetical protein
MDFYHIFSLPSSPYNNLAVHVGGFYVHGP